MVGGLVGQRVRPSVSPDAVVVVPGIMGSTLESESGVVWGLHRLGWYVKAWTDRRSALDELTLTADEREGRYGRIRATGLLRRPAWAPFLQGIEPYGDLLDGIGAVVVHEDAVCSFPYDWRLPVAYNASRLEGVARAHLAAWRKHPEYQRFRGELPDSRPAQLVIVAHSMGGLLTRSLPEDLDVRATVTLATPFDGAAKAALILNTGRGAPLPLPRERLRAMGKTLPGLHDLLPTYRCLDDVDDDTDPVRLTPALVEDIGGDPDLAAASFAWHQQVGARRPPGHRSMIGVKQPTDSSLTLHSGVLTGHGYTFDPTAAGLARDRHGILVRSLRYGDGTVPYNSAAPNVGGPAATLAQQHGPIAKSKESIDFVQTVLLEGDVDAPRLGDGQIGIELPDLISESEEVTVRITGVDGPTDATVVVRDEDGLPVDYPTVFYGDGAYRARFGPLAEGIFQVEVEGSGESAASQRVLVSDA
jgi:Lecithin:cholesterol acyltransferase